MTIVVIFTVAQLTIHFRISITQNYRYSPALPFPTSIPLSMFCLVFVMSSVYYVYGTFVISRVVVSRVCYVSVCRV